MKVKYGVFKIFVLIVCLALMVLLMNGCATSSPKESVGEPAEAPVGKPAEAPKEELPEIRARLGGLHAAGSLYSEAQRNFTERVKEKTGGKLIIEHYPASQLGTAREMIESCQAGAIEGIDVGAAFFGAFNPTISITILPYLFPTLDAATEVLMGEAGRAILDTLEKNGLKGIDFSIYTSHHYVTKFPVREPSDLKGQLVRVMENPILIAQYEALGAAPVPVAFHEVYSALQLGVVNGLESTLPSIYNASYYEVTDYFTETDHSLLTSVLAFNKDWFDALPEEYQMAIFSAAREEVEALNIRDREFDENVIKPKIKEAGLEITILTQGERAKFAAIGAPAAEEALRKALDPEGVEILEMIKGKAAKYWGN